MKTGRKQCILSEIGMLLFLFLEFFIVFTGEVWCQDKLTGLNIIEEVFKRHELYPHVFEEQTLIMVDKSGNRDVKMARRFSRVEKDGIAKFLLVFDNPVEVRGVAFLAIIYNSGNKTSNVYLPAFGSELRSSIGNDRGGLLLGTDFALEDLTGEVLSQFSYVRVEDHKIKNISYYVVEVYPEDEGIKNTTGYSLRRHYIRQDIFFIVRTDYYNRRGRIFKRQTNHDLKRVDGDMWRANMVLMENFKKKHKTLVKVTRRVFSHDYVPPEMFTKEWILGNRHMPGEQGRLLQKVFPFQKLERKESVGKDK